MTVTGDGPPNESSSSSFKAPVHGPGLLHVLTIPAVKAGIDTLQGFRIHEQFPAYLHVRQQAMLTGVFDQIDPEWNQVGQLFKMPGGPAKKPNYRPWSRKVKDPSRFWYNDNLAGSFSPSSLRTTSRFMLNEAGDGFALPEDHAQQALAILLKGSRLPAWALAAYYLRNYGFLFEGSGGYDELIAGFKREFMLEDSVDFEILFEDSTPPLPVDWFELHNSQPAGIEAPTDDGEPVA